MSGAFWAVKSETPKGLNFMGLVRGVRVRGEVVVVFGEEEGVGAGGGECGRCGGEEGEAAGGGGGEEGVEGAGGGGGE